MRNLGKKASGHWHWTGQATVAEEAGQLLKPEAMDVPELGWELRTRTPGPWASAKPCSACDSDPTLTGLQLPFPIRLVR